MLFILSMLLTGCGIDNGFAGFTGDEYYRLLTNDSSKVWKKNLEKLEGKALDSDICQDLTLLEFGKKDDFSQTLYFKVKLDPKSCGDNSSVLDSGTWMLSINSPDPIPTDTILFISGSDTTMKWILEISALNLTLESELNGEEFTESYFSVEGL